MIAFSLFPVTIRYGRAFQPDALMLGAVLAGLNCWDRAETRRRLVVAGCGLAVPGAGICRQGHRGPCPDPTGGRDHAPEIDGQTALRGHRSGAGAALVLLGQSPDRIECRLSGLGGEPRDLDDGVLASRPSGIPQTLTYLWRFLVIRAFTPPGLALGVWGLCQRSSDRRAI